MYPVYFVLGANILVTGFYGSQLLFNRSSQALAAAYGEPSVASNIVGAFYVTVCLFSIYGLFATESKLEFISYLVLTQIVYKIIFVATSPDFSNPVVSVNLLIAVVYAGIYWISLR